MMGVFIMCGSFCMWISLWFMISSIKMNNDTMFLNVSLVMCGLGSWCFVHVANDAIMRVAAMIAVGTCF